MRKKSAGSTRRIRRPANRSSLPALDGFDHKILHALVDNARASNVEIAQKVGLSEAPCSRRIRRLESEEVILGYHARLDPEAIGIGFVAFVTLVLDYVTATTAERFYQEIRAIPEIMSCYIVSGGYDALLHVAAKDSHSYSEIVFDRLRRIPGVKDVRSSFVMRTIKEGRALPLVD
ncbi:MAG: Lrp/AsnC family transcriptional regulator [Xanthobacteraceae bacterium]|nr:Lrp/AsnC family transcriptional regulator [Xanthobacteraceae bacterium]